MQPYWKGMMNWPIEVDAICATCGTEFVSRAAPGLVFSVALTWGLVHGECRCNVCHTPYSMRPSEAIVTTPWLLIKEEYRAAAHKLWETHHTPIDEWTNDQWNEAKESTK